MLLLNIVTKLVFQAQKLFINKQFVNIQLPDCSWSLIEEIPKKHTVVKLTNYLHHFEYSSF